MRRLCTALLALLLTAPALADSPAFAQSMVKTDHVRAELVSELGQVKAGEPFWVGLRQTIIPKWHTYWKNPGDSGLPTDIDWKLPDGAKADAIVWPAPTLDNLGGIINYGYSGDVMLLVRITPPATGDKLDLALEATWLVCEDVCVPEEVKLSLSLPMGGEAKPADAATRALFDKMRRTVPVPSPWAVRYGLSRTGDPALFIEARGLKAETLREIYFFPGEWGKVAHMAEQKATIDADGIRIPLKKGDAKPDAKAGAAKQAPPPLIGTLVLTEKTGDGENRQAFDLEAAFDPKYVPSTPALSFTGDGEQLTLVEALFFALVGGLILNLMPCVFPVLAMKAAAFAKLAGGARAEMRRDGLAYTAGVLASFGAMAGVLVAIRASLGDVGWGFQFQSPIFSLLIAYLFFTIGLNLSGMFEIGGRFAGMGQGLAARGGGTGAFFTGVLAVVVATPCTAPFMAAALGFALTQPAPQTFAVLLALGAGLALPYLALSMTPALQRLMPRPGLWMDRLRQFLAFPMYASAAWMIWVLTQQAGADGVMYALGGLILIAFAVWIFRMGDGTGGGAEGRPSWLRSGLVAASLLLILGTVIKIDDGDGPSATATTASVSGGVNFEGWERFSRSRMVEAAAQGKPVFVDFTAAWCITCLVNERVALETPAAKRAFEQAGVVKLKGDWTNRDPEITATLKEAGRAGVPLYLYWAPGADKPKILPQVLTEAMIVSELTSSQQAKK